MIMIPFLLSLSFPYHQPIIDTPFVYHHSQPVINNGLLPYWLHSLLTLHNHLLILSIGMHLLSQSYCYHCSFSLLSLYLGISQLFIQCICPIIVLYRNQHPSFVYPSLIITAGFYTRLFSQAYYHCLLDAYLSFNPPMHHLNHNSLYASMEIVCILLFLQLHQLNGIK